MCDIQKQKLILAHCNHFKNLRLFRRFLTFTLEGQGVLEL
jgi:hypothetical protein